MKQHDDVIRKALSVSPILGKRIKGFYFVVFLLLGLLLPFVTISNASNEDLLASVRYGQYVITAASAPNSLLIRLCRGAGLKASGMEIQKVIDAVLSPAETDSVRLLAASDFSSSELKDLLDRSYVITVGFCVLALVLFFQVINIAVLRVAYLKADPALRCFYLLGSRNLEIKLKANLFAMRLLCRRGMMGLAFGLPLGLAAVSFLVYLPVSILLSVLYGIAALVLSASVHFVASKAILSDLGFASELGRAR